MQQPKQYHMATPAVWLLPTLLLLWAWRRLCIILRRRREAYMASLDPDKDAIKLSRMTMFVEFPFLSYKAYEFAVFRTLAIPSISALLDRTGQFSQANLFKRYDDTTLLFEEFLLNALDSPRGSLALRRLNFLHGRYHISNRDMLYTLTLFVLEPARLAGKFGYRPWTDAEVAALLNVWRRIGEAMGLNGIPDTAADMAEFQRRYEEKHMRYADSNRRVGEASVWMMLSWLPRPLWPLARRAMLALMDERLLKAMGFERQPLWVEKLVHVVVRFFAGTLVALVMPPRPLEWSTERIVLAHDEEEEDVRKIRKVRFNSYGGGAYPEGYRIQDLGAAEPGKVADLHCPVSRFRI